MSIWTIILSSIVVYVATFLLAEWIANDGGLPAREYRPVRPDDPAAPDGERLE